MNKLRAIQDIIGGVNYREYTKYLRRYIKKGDPSAKETLDIINKEILEKFKIITSGSGYVLRHGKKIYDFINVYGEENPTRFTRKDYAEGFAKAFNLEGCDIDWER